MNILDDFYVAVDPDGSEWFFQGLPERTLDNEVGDQSWECNTNVICHARQLTKGTIESITGVKMTWEDDPIKVTIKKAI